MTGEKYHKRCSALTGSIATGKSTVAKYFQSFGAHLVDTDQIARSIVEPGSVALGEICREFGQNILLENGNLNRQKLRDIIINSEEKKVLLNEITHPHVKSVMEQQIDICLKENDMPVIVDIPLLYEIGWENYFENIIVVYAPVTIQIERLMKRDSLTMEIAKKTVNAQMSIEEKIKNCSFVVDNSLSLENSKKQSSEIFIKLKKGV